MRRQRPAGEKRAVIRCPACQGDDPVIVAGIDHDSDRIDVGICSRCGLGYQLQPLSLNDTKKYYYQNSTFQEVHNNSRQRRLAISRLKFIREYLEDDFWEKPQAVALDIGCGYGSFLAALPDSWTRIGLELNPHRADCARKHFGLQILETTLEESDLATNSVDVITAFGLIEHLVDVQSFFTELKRILKPEGLLIINVPDLTRPLMAFSQFFTIEHTLYFTASTLQALLQRQGFTVLHRGQTAYEYPDIACICKTEEKIHYQKKNSVPGRRDHFPVSQTRSAAQDPDTGSSNEINVQQTEKERDKILSAVKQYHVRRSRYLHDIVKRLRNKSLFTVSETLAIYGAGDHTVQLAKALPEIKNVKIFIDSDPMKKGQPFLNGIIHSPEEIPALKIRSILVSSRAFEDEIVHSLREKFGNSIEIHTLYNYC
ncbi:class I SAM-dependent methyltransferase [Desulfolithobacter sp.]